MSGQFRLLSSGGKKQPWYAAIQLFPPCVQYVFSCFDTTGCEAYSFTTDGYGIFNVHTNLFRVPYTRRGIRHKQYY